MQRRQSDECKCFMSKIITNRRRGFEIVSVVITGLGKILFVDFLDLKFVFVNTAIIFWGLYLILRVTRHNDLIYYWGLSLANIKATFKIVAPIGVIFTVLFLTYGYYCDTIILNRNIIFVLATYPIWGLIQQFLVMSLFAGNLKDYKRINLHDNTIVIITSCFFAIVHYPSFQLIILTFFMALFYSVIFLKKRNIIPLGFFHGILGGLFYYFVLNRDPWVEFIKILYP